MGSKSAPIPPQIAAPAKADARAGARRRLLKAGIIAFNDRFCTLPCAVRNLSTTGARLSVNASINAPDTFELIIELDGLEADCEVVWRGVDEIGVKFSAPVRIAAPKRTQVIAPIALRAPPSLRRKPRPRDVSAR